jgi:hypothetical protein
LGFLPFKNDAITILLTKIIMLVVAQFDSIHVQIASLHRCGVDSKDQVAYSSLSTCCSVIGSTNSMPSLLGKVLAWAMGGTCVLQACMMIS